MSLWSRIFTHAQLEVWMPIPSWPGYEASNKGRIRSWLSNNQSMRSMPLVLVQMTQSGRRYKRVNLHKDKKMSQRGVHRLVAEAFLGESELQVNHIDGNPENNSLENLEYCTAKQNIQHAFNAGLMPPRRGEANGATKLTADQVREIRARYKPFECTRPMLAKEFGVCEGTIGSILSRKIWSHLE